MWRSSVDLPEPEAPSSATISPRRTVSETFDSAACAPKCLLRFCTSIAAGIIVRSS